MNRMRERVIAMERDARPTDAEREAKRLALIEHIRQHGRRHGR